MTAFDDFTASMLRSAPNGPSVNLKSAPTLSPTPTFSIVIPVFNEAAGLSTFIQQIESTLRGQFYEVVFVDNGSTDGTWREIEIASRRHCNWQGIRLTRSFGHEAAKAAGIEAARGRAIVTMGADGQHPPEHVRTMIDRWREGAKVVQMIPTNGSRAGILKKGTPSSDFRLLDRSVVEIISKTNGPASYHQDLIPWLGCRTIDISYTPGPRLNTESKPTISKKPPSAANTANAFSMLALKLATYFGITLTGTSLAFLFYLALLGIAGPHAVAAWAVTAGLLALFGGVQLIGLGLIGEYVGRVFTAHLGRPTYVIADKIGATSPSHASNPVIEIDPLSPVAQQRRNESVRLITAHIGHAETVTQPNRRMESRIEIMRSEEATYAPLST